MGIVNINRMLDYLPVLPTGNFSIVLVTSVCSVKQSRIVTRQKVSIIWNESI